MKTSLSLLVCGAAALMLIGCGDSGGSGDSSQTGGGSGSSSGGASSFVSFTQEQIGTTAETTDPTALEQVAPNVPEDAEPIEIS